MVAVKVAVAVFVAVGVSVGVGVGVGVNKQPHSSSAVSPLTRPETSAVQQSAGGVGAGVMSVRGM